MRITVALAFFGLCLSGCARYRTERGATIDESALSLEAGRTGRAEILRELGPPARMAVLPGGYVFLYEHFAILEKQLGITIGYRWLSLFKFAYGWASADRQALLLFIGDDEFLRSSEYLEWEEDLGSGFSIDFILSVVSLVDTSHLEEDSPEHTWGAGLLREASLTPDGQRRLEDEATGLDLWGTPDLLGGEHN